MSSGITSNFSHWLSHQKIWNFPFMRTHGRGSSIQRRRTHLMVISANKVKNLSVSEVRIVNWNCTVYDYDHITNGSGLQLPNASAHPTPPRNYKQSNQLSTLENESSKPVSDVLYEPGREILPQSRDSVTNKSGPESFCRDGVREEWHWRDYSPKSDLQMG